MATILTIDGNAINRPASRTVLNRLRLSIDEPDQLEWSQAGVGLPPAWHPGQAVQLTVDGTPVFHGQLVSVHPGRDPRGIVVGYRALGLKFLANTLPVTNPNDQTGTIVYNLPSDDPDYLASESGLSVGTILGRLFDAHAAALAALRIVGYRAADLAALTVVPPEPVVIQGSRFWNAVESLLTRWANAFAAYIPADGTIRVVDTTAFTPTTLTLDTDPVELESISRDISDCATQVVVRGAADVEPAYLSLGDGTLTPAFTAQDQQNWNYADFTEPQGAVDDGTVTALTSTQATIQSNNAGTAWPANFWSGIQGWVYLINPVATGLTQTEARRVVACTPLASGGSATITFDRPLDNGGYTRYHLVGQPQGLSNCWRLYSINNPYIAEHLVKKFPRPVPWRTSDSVVLTNYPTAAVCWSPTGAPPYIEFPATFEVLPQTGQVRFTEPVVRVFGTLANLQTGGSATDGIPADLLVLVPYSRGTLTATAPAAGGYQGTAFTADQLQRTLFVDIPSWTDAADLPAMQALAQAILDTVKDTVVEGLLTYHGKYAGGLTLGLALNIACGGGATGWEAMNAPVRAFTLEWPQAGADRWVSRFEFSTRRRPFTGDRLYVHPGFTGTAAWDVRP